MDSNRWPGTDDTIAALCSPWPMPGAVARSAIRISGPQAFDIVAELAGLTAPPGNPGLFGGMVYTACGLKCPASFYIFCAPHSYTGQDIVEIHTFAARPALELVLERIFGKIRQAGPGEFTFRAYLNGKCDLTEAEAVAHIISASNQAQLDAAARLLQGRLGRTIKQLRDDTTELLGMIEAGLDFSDQNIEIVPAKETEERIEKIVSSLKEMLENSVRCEYFIELPSVGLTAAPNAGKSSLLNALTGTQRSIVSDACGTTRDVLRQILSLTYGDCVLFDCAGIGKEAQGPLESLADEAARQAISAADMILLCADISKTDWAEDLSIMKIIRRQKIIAVATKSDLLSGEQVVRQTKRLKSLFGLDFIPVSAKTGAGLCQLKDDIDAALHKTCATNEALAINCRHREKLTESINALTQAAGLISGGQDEIAAMLIRSAIRQMSQIQDEEPTEEVLEGIFSRFCIGK